MNAYLGPCNSASGSQCGSSYLNQPNINNPSQAYPRGLSPRSFQNLTLLIIIHRSHKVSRKRVRGKKNKDGKGVEDKGCGHSVPGEMSDPSAYARGLSSSPRCCLSYGRAWQVEGCESSCSQRVLRNLQARSCIAGGGQFYNIHPTWKVFKYLPTICCLSLWQH